MKGSEHEKFQAQKWQKGRSGNPGGRPKMDPDAKKILKDATPQAAQLLVDMMQNRSIRPETRMRCAEIVMERVYGKPTQPIDGNIDSSITITLAGELEEYAK